MSYFPDLRRHNSLIVRVSILFRDEKQWKREKKKKLLGGTNPNQSNNGRQP